MDATIESSCQFLIYISEEMKCAHGTGRTFPDPDGHGVKIECPAEKDCWVVKWERVA